MDKSGKKNKPGIIYHNTDIISIFFLNIEFNHVVDRTSGEGCV